MDKWKIVGILIGIVVILAIGLILFGTIQHIPFISRQPNVSIRNHTFSVDVAITSAQKEKGLSGRSSLPSGHGMYFPFQTPGFYPFWMKDMRIPIDIIYIAQGKVVTIFSNVQPSPNPYNTIVKPTQAADGVLEISSGEAQKDGIKVGDSVTTNL